MQRRVPLWLLLGALWGAAHGAAPLSCPLSMPTATLSMACSSVCPDGPLSPCVYFSQASDCVAAEDSGSVCVSSPTKGDCAVQCFSPFASSSGAWSFMVTDDDEYKKDVSDRRLKDAGFQLAKQAVPVVAAIRDLQFPSGATTVSISGNALPILDKAVDYPVIYKGDVLSVDAAQGWAFLANATQAATILIENLDLSTLTAFPTLSKLTELQLGNGRLRAIPTGLAQLPALKRLDLSLNSLTSVASGQLPTTLVDLCLQDCGLESVPSDILTMPNLKKLDLSGNKFPLPPNGSLPLHVEHLVWWGLYHERLPPDLPRMAKLKKLELGWNDFSKTDTLSLLPTSLEELHLIDVLLPSLPPSFGQLTQLAWMEAGKNAIKSVTKGTVPPNIQFLNLSINWIATIEPSALPTGLKTLDLRVNALQSRSFPSDFGSLASLQTLYLHSNQLESVPPAIFHLPKLRTLTMHDNANMTRVTLSASEIAFLSQLEHFTIDQRGLETDCKSPQAIGTTGYTVCLTGDKTTSSPSGKDSKDAGDKNTGSSASNANRSLIIGLGTSIGGLLAILIGGVHWKRRRDASNAANTAVMHQSGGDDDKGRLSGGGKVAGGCKTTVNDLYNVEEERRNADGATDVTAYADMSTMETRRAAQAGSSSACSSTVTTTQATASGKKTRITKTTTTTTTTTTMAAAHHTTSSRSATATSSAMGVAGDAVLTSGRYSIWDDEELLQWRVDFQAIRDVQQLASGMFGEVWLAIYMSRHVAVKRLKKQLSNRGGRVVSIDSSATGSGLGTTDPSTNVVQRFVQEIKLHSRLDHPKIVQFVGVAWTMESDVQAVVEYMPNGDLRSFLGSFEPKIERLDDASDATMHHWDACAIQIAVDVVEALVYLHSLDPPVLHRDLKSRNVLLDDALRAKLSDFGISRYHFDDDTQELMTMGVGTARWTAPEVLTGATANYTSAIDMYSLGVILSELDTWRLPFSELSDLPESAILNRVCAGELQPRFRTSSPREIVEIARRCLALEPSQRPSAVEVAYVLRQSLAKSQPEAAGDVEGLESAASRRSSIMGSRSSLTAIGAAMSI